MSQYEAPYTDYVERPRQSSGMATAAVVLGVLGLIPICGALFGVLALIVGLIAIATLGDRTGKGRAIVGILLGVITTVIWGAIIVWFVQLSIGYVEFVQEGPNQTLEKGFRGDIAGFKADFDGAGTAATDDEARAFLDELNDRYGTFIEARIDEQAGPPPQPGAGQPVMDMPYKLAFSNETVDAEVELIFANQQATSFSDAFAKKIGSITVFDPDRGDLTYPQPTGGAPTDGTDAAADDADGAESDTGGESDAETGGGGEDESSGI